MQYWLAGRAILERADVYDPAAWRALHDAVGSRGDEIAPGLAFLYPLPTALYALPIAVLPFRVAYAVWFVAQGATALVALVALGRRLFVVAPRRDLVLMLALAAATEPAFLLGNDGNIVRFLPGIVGGALALLLADRPRAAGALLGLAIVKPQLLLVFVPLLLAACPARARAPLVAGGAATVGASVLVALAIRPDWIGAWLGQAAAARGSYGLINVWSAFPAAWGGAAWLVAGASVAAFASWMRRVPADLARRAAVALGLSVFLAPYAADYDQTVLVVGVPVFVAAIAPLPGPARAAFVAAFVATSPLLVVLAAAGLIEGGATLVVPGVALSLLVVAGDALARGRPAATGPGRAAR